MENNITLSENNGNTEVIRKLEERLALLEKQLNLQTDKADNDIPAQVKVPGEENEMEFRIGQFWLPKLGILVFIMGIIFFLTLPFAGIAPILPSVGGYTLALIILALAHFTRNNFPGLNSYFVGGSAVIAYLSTLRLYFFGSENVFGSWIPEFLGLSFVVSTTLWYSLKNDSPYLASLALFLSYVAALTIGNTYILLFAILLTAASSVRIYIKKGWQGFFIFSTISAFLSHAAWFMSNPFYGNGFESVSRPDLNLVFILGYVILFAAGLIKRPDNSSEEFMDVLCSLINSAFGYGLFLIITLLTHQSSFAPLHLLAAVIFLGTATVFWTKEKSQYSTFIYAMTGYAALSVAIVFNFSQPWNLIYLCWQSILVVSTAVWFRSRFIIVANYIIFLIVLAAYLFTYWTLETEAISFGLAALISARILNWQKDRLELKTEVLRLSYLVIALFWIPYLFYCVLPSVYVGLSLLALSLAYFGVGKLINNLRYRWMAVNTLLITVFYLMIFGITNPDTYYKIISFLAAGVILIITSAVYNRISRTSRTKIN